MAQSERELREDFTDLDYDRYLYARGQPNRLVAGEVLRGSAASEAGLRRGDVILSYGDVRVFNPGEILRASAQGDLGKSVSMEILRNGQRRTVYVRQGPLGVILEHSQGEPVVD
jgi:S1-C subfamily serine protease